VPGSHDIAGPELSVGTDIVTAIGAAVKTPARTVRE
jgi:hypothetical protein